MRYFLAVSLGLLLLLASGCGSKADDTGSVNAAKSSEGSDAVKTDSTSPAAAGVDKPSEDAPRAPRTGVSAAPQSGGMGVGRAILASNPGPVTINRSVIRRAELTVRVKNVEEAERQAQQIVKQSQGYVEGTQSNDLSSDQALITLTARVPVGTFDDDLAKFEHLGVRVNKKISGEDVTGKILDTDARLKTMRAQEEVYRNLLRQTRKLSDVLAMQTQLEQLRERIEGTAAQLKGLRELSDLSTIQLTLTQSLDAVTSRPQDTGWAPESWAQAKAAGFAFYKGVVVVLMWLIVFCPVWIGGYFAIRAMSRAAAKQRAKNPPPPPTIEF